ncbi:Predicted DNA binding protein, contains HTH domain [Halomicrobium zhouii]|uniref:Predicted DNA binding protein, contains HTH domain n=1 Tax=Halomicrobium zhouii TaxID=767519 RepID=A0A1I6L8V3_9EURY|nr:helix-turn-helix domain-containing protein [Halomicrobium zhouii]SFR99905.1 Predicted DNA binding protein, contains HTH domain [Halomicrobium zhouii]
MAVIAEFSVDHVDFALSEIFETCPDATVELDRVVPTDEALLPYFWVWDADADAVAELVGREGTVSRLELVDEVEGGGLFRAWWTREMGGILQAMATSDLTLRKAVGSADDWLFELRAEHPSALSAFQRYLTEIDVEASLVRLHELDEDATTGRYNLTPEQHEALQTAYDRGYYQQPAEVDLESLAAELGISRSAFSARLKRGYRNLIEATIAHEQDPDAER